MSNAVKFTPEGGRVIVRHRVETEGDNCVVVVEISDTGVGIPPQDMPDLFPRFYRASNATAPGTGLGLAIVREIVENRHHGSVTVESQFGEGSTFTVRLPAGPAAD